MNMPGHESENKTNVPSSVEIAIVGAGPAGLATACALRKHGISVAVLDAAPKPSSYSRATIIHCDTLKALDSIDVAEHVVSKGIPISAINAWTQNVCLASIPIRQEDEKYATSVAMPQNQLEEILSSRLDSLGGTFIRGATVSGITDSGYAVHLVVLGAAGSRTEISADYVVAADGLHSMIRQMLGIAFEGGDYIESMLAADCRLDTTGKFSLVPNEASVCFGSDGFVLFMPETPDIWRVLVPLKNAPKGIDAVQLQKLVNKRAPPGIQVQHVIWSNRFRIHHRHAQTYRKGRVFLVGDAAHTFSPIGGQGMNLGIQEGITLARILRVATDERNDTDTHLARYEEMRRSVATDAMSMTHKFTTVGQWKSSWARCVRNWYIELFMQISGLQLNKAQEIRILDGYNL